MKVRKGILISFSGIDGAGKSTIIKEIHDFLLTEYGLKSKIIWCKFGDYPLSSRSSPKFHNYIGKFNKKNNNKSISRWGAADKQSISHKIYFTVLLLLHYTQIFLIRYLLLSGNIILCDRYIFDTIVDLQQEFHYSLEKAQRSFSKKWIPKPNISFLLDLPEEISYQRKQDIYSVSFLKERRLLYLSIADCYRLNIIEASNPMDIVVTQIIGDFKGSLLKAYFS